jgi:hypothetical protein
MDVVSASDQIIESNKSLPFRLGRLVRADVVEDCEDDGSSLSEGVMVPGVYDFRRPGGRPFRMGDLHISDTRFRNIAFGCSSEIFAGAELGTTPLKEREDRNPILGVDMLSSLVCIDSAPVEQDRSSFRRFVGLSSISSTTSFALAAASYWAWMSA